MGVPDLKNRSSSHPWRRGQGLPKKIPLQTWSVVLLVLFLDIPSTLAQDYCSIKCKGEIHTMCLFSKEPGAACQNYQPDYLTQAERDTILHKHNELRNKMALGQVPPFPSAADMMEMTWDDELAQIAQRWADQCSFKHDKCRNSRRFSVGQNLAVFYTNGPDFPAPETRVQSWYDEISLYPYSPGPFYFSTATGHFTQIVWGSTNLLGCARSRYVINDFTHQLLVCNYGPGGNVMGRPLYTSGPPCSQCSCSAKYSGLCAVGSKVNTVTENRSTFADFFPSYSPFFFSTTTNVPPYYTNSVYSTTPYSFFYTNPPTTRQTSFTQPRTYTQATTTRAYQTTRRPPPTQTTAVTRRAITTAPPKTTPSTFLPASCPLPSTPGQACGPKRPAPLPLTPSEKTALLRLHNKWRAELARGGVAGFPAAADMKQMEWDNELADLAQRWADQCIWGHDPCRKTSRHAFKGQNIALSYGTNEAIEQRALEWFDESRFFKFADSPYQFVLNTSHFSQMAWADTYQLGCARARFPIVGNDANMLVCNYGPGGNVPGRKLYTPGPPCSKCGRGSCSPVYSSLCAASTNVTSQRPTTQRLTTQRPVTTQRPTTQRLTTQRPVTTQRIATTRRPLITQRIATTQRPVTTQRLFTTQRPAFTYATTTALSTRRLQQPQQSNELDAGLPSTPFIRPSVCPRPEGPGPACGAKYRPAALSSFERSALLEAHNSIRSRVAAGLVKKLPQAANMNQLVWDDQLAKLAQTWADQCTLGYDTCARTDLYQAGQNMAVWYSHDIENFPPPQERVNGWFKEIDNFNYVNGLFVFNVGTSALTQMLWANTKKIGCGRARFVANGSEVAAELLVCNYGPGGNIIDRKIYLSGTPCSRCDVGSKCSANYSALCSTS